MRTLTTALLLAIAGCGSGPPNGPFVDAALLVKAPPPTSQVALRLLLVGDAGNPEYARCALPAGRNAAPLDHCVMQQAAAAGQLVEHSALVLLGDNVYPDGIPDGEGIAQKRVLDQQLLAAQTSGSALLIVPGNHDWASGRPGGLAAIQRARARVLATFQQPAWALGTTAPWWIEKAGCPGPGTWDSPDGRVRIIGIDTQWWLHKDEAERRTCGDLAQVEKDAVAGIERALATAGDRLTIVATHHPMASFGSHRLGSTSPQDIPSPPYQALIASLNRALAAHPPHLFVAGHDHDLQVLRGGPAGVPARVAIVSGAGSKVRDLTAAPPGDQLVFAQGGHLGFMTLDLLTDGRVLLTVTRSEKASARQPGGFDQQVFDLSDLLKRK